MANKKPSVAERKKKIPPFMGKKKAPLGKSHAAGVAVKVKSVRGNGRSALSKLPPDKIDAAMKKVRELIEVVTSGEDIPREVAEKVIVGVLENYKARLAVGLIGISHAKLRRITRTMEYLESVEARLFEDRTLDTLRLWDPGALSTVASNLQLAMTRDIEFVRKIVFMEAEILNLLSAAGGSKGQDDILAALGRYNDPGKILAGLPELEAESRERVSRFAARIKKLAGEK